MPAELASNASNTVFHYGGGISPPANWTAWSNFINQFTSLLVARYGLAEVSTWKFEVWNEPDCESLPACGVACDCVASQQAAWSLLRAAAGRGDVWGVMEDDPCPASPASAGLPGPLARCRDDGAQLGALRRLPLPLCACVERLRRAASLVLCSESSCQTLPSYPLPARAFLSLRPPASTLPRGCRRLLLREQLLRRGLRLSGRVLQALQLCVDRLAATDACAARGAPRLRLPSLLSTSCPCV